MDPLLYGPDGEPVERPKPHFHWEVEDVSLRLSDNWDEGGRYMEIEAKKPNLTPQVDKRG